MPDSNHPVWATARLVVLALLAGVLLYVNASRPDITEVKAWLGIVMGMVLTELGVKVVKSVGTNKDPKL